MAEPLPTFVIGAGQAGIAVLETLASLPDEETEAEAFEYYAIDTDKEMLNTNAPSQATTRFLPHPDDFVEDDTKSYPYLTRNMSTGPKGAERQRPVGRYKIDNRGTPDIDEIYRQDLYNAIERHYQEHQNAITTRDQGSFNIFLIHSLGGGTGSGTYPLLSSMVARIATELQETYGVDMYVAGVGIIPRLKLGDMTPGDPMYYPNSYASLRDLTHLLDATESDPLRVSLWAREKQSERDSLRSRDHEVGNYIELRDEAYDNYFLVGVDEDKISGDAATSGGEGYSEFIDQTVGQALYALSNYSGSVENWSRDNANLARIGTFGQGEIRVPVADIREYCEAKARKESIEEQREQGLPEQQSALRDRKDRLEEIKQDPASILEHEGEDLRTNIGETLQNHLGAGGTVAKRNGPDDFQSALDAVERQFGLEAQLLAIDVLEEMLEDPNGAVAIEESWREVVTTEWKDLDLSSKPEYGGEAADTVGAKQEGILNYLNDKINEWEEFIEEHEDEEGGIVDGITNTLFGSEVEKRREWIETYQNKKDEVLEKANAYDDVETLRDEIDDARTRTRQQLNDEIQELDDEIDDIQAEIQRLRREAEKVDRTIEDKADELTSKDRTGRRRVILPIKPEKLPELDRDRFEDELDSLADFIDQGFIDETLFERALEQRYEASKAWEDPIVDRDVEGISPIPDDRNEVWFLYHEANSDYATLDNIAQTGTFRGPDGGKVEYIDDPYRMAFVTFTNRGPTEALEVYRDLEAKVENGDLDKMSDFKDYRLSFAYPEWYDREIREAFDIQVEIEVPKPPELDLGRVRVHVDSEGKQKNYIKKNGLDAYIWQGIHWDQYAATGDPNPFEGWQETLSKNAVEYRGLTQATPSPDLKSDWLSNRESWDAILDAYRDNLVEETGVDVTFVEPDD